MRVAILGALTVWAGAARAPARGSPLYSITDLGPVQYPTPVVDDAGGHPLTVGNDGWVNYIQNGWSGFSATAGEFTASNAIYHLHGGSIPLFAASLQKGSDQPILVLPQGADQSYASGINNAGLLVGQGFGYAPLSFIYSYSARGYLTPTWPSLAPTFYYGISDQNQLVGSVGASPKQVMGASGNLAFINSHAWLGALNPGTVGWGGLDLNQLIPGTSGWTLTSATGINNRGQIVGYGVDPQGDYHEYELTPLENQVPEPTVLVLFGLVGTGLAARAARVAVRGRGTAAET
jgi:hypothetical protein